MNIVNKLKKIRVIDIIGMIKLIASYPFGRILRNRYSNIWLITERPNDARDNGYYLFKYIRENHKDDNVYYAINSNSKDFAKIEKLGQWIEFGSFKHFVYYWAAKYNISSQIGTGEPSDRICLNLEKLGIIKNNKIFLQHGVIKDILNFALYKNCKVNTFICSSKNEYEFVKNEFGYPEGSIKCLGLCRFDGLHKVKVNEKQILIMPTWRTWLDEIKCSEEFVKSEYFNTYMSLLNNDILIEFIERENLKIIFYPHDNMQKYINEFVSKSEQIIIANKKDFDVQNLLKESSLLITDYSSVFFDFAYMKKPILYYHFDIKKYRENHYREGYFSYYRDGFGPVINEEGILVEDIKKLYKNKWISDTVYSIRGDKFFQLKDNSNCERTYKSIKGDVNDEKRFNY